MVINTVIVTAVDGEVFAMASGKTVAAVDRNTLIKDIVCRVVRHNIVAHAVHQCARKETAVESYIHIAVYAQKIV